MDINNRVRDLRKSLKLTQKEFGGRIHVAQTYLSQIENGDREVTDKIAQLIVLEFGVNENWLRTGSGKAFLENEKKQRDFLDIFDGLSPALQDYLLKTARDLLETQSKLETPPDEDS